MADHSKRGADGYAPKQSNHNLNPSLHLKQKAHTRLDDQFFAGHA